MKVGPSSSASKHDPLRASYRVGPIDEIKASGKAMGRSPGGADGMQVPCMHEAVRPSRRKSKAETTLEGHVRRDHIEL
jgi:hypothetical protein